MRAPPTLAWSPRWQAWRARDKRRPRRRARRLPSCTRAASVLTRTVPRAGTQIELEPDVFFYWFLGFANSERAMTRLQSLVWGAWAVIVHVAVLGVGLVLMHNLSSEGIIGLRYRKGGASEWQVTLKVQDLPIANRMLGAECVFDSSKAGVPTATPCGDIWPATPQVRAAVAALFVDLRATH